MSDRIVRDGTVLAVAAQGCRVGVSSPCSRCSTGCLAFASKPPDTAIDIPGHCVVGKSGRMGAPVLVEISRQGLTRLSIFLFGPVILAMITLAGLASMGNSGFGFSVVSVLAICVALLVSRNLARRVANTGLGLRITTRSGVE